MTYFEYFRFPKNQKTWRVFVSLCFAFISATIQAQSGCTDPLANNYDPLAITNDGSCTYNAASISPTNSTTLSSTLNENSGLILWDNTIWTHNDGGNPEELYSIDVANLSSFSSLNLSGVVNTDWEDITQDDNYVYIGDFGNNVNGNRTDLKIYRIEKNSIQIGTPVIDVINFSYADQIDFTPQGGNNTDFDCEAMIATDTMLYLFTKEWVSNQTTVYALPKTPGTHVATNEGSYNVNGLITGATYIKGKQLVVLSGYSDTLSPFIVLLYDFSGNNFLSGNKRKLNLNLAFHQVEGITSKDGLNYYVSNEFFSSTFPIIGTITVQPQIHEVNLNSFLLDYIGYETSENATVFSNPSSWAPGLVPPTNSDVLISQSLTLDQDYTANSVQVSSDAILTIEMDKLLTTKSILVRDNASVTVMSSNSITIVD